MLVRRHNVTPWHRNVNAKFPGSDHFVVLILPHLMYHSPLHPRNAATHTLTLTADLQLSARGTKEEEDVVILLSEVALRQCELVQTEEWIEPELDEVRDPLLLLDAEGMPWQ